MNRMCAADRGGGAAGPGVREPSVTVSVSRRFVPRRIADGFVVQSTWRRISQRCASQPRARTSPRAPRPDARDAHAARVGAWYTHTSQILNAPRMVACIHMRHAMRPLAWRSAPLRRVPALTPCPHPLPARLSGGRLVGPRQHRRGILTSPLSRACHVEAGGAGRGGGSRRAIRAASSLRPADGPRPLWLDFGAQTAGTLPGVSMPSSVQRR